MTQPRTPAAHVSEHEARAVAEASRETAWTAPSFVRELFLGRVDLRLLHPHPEPDPEEQQRGRAFLDRLERFLRDEVDPEQVERDSKIPDRLGPPPARMSTTAVPPADGTAYLLNGEKLWCTNGTIAELLVVMARTPGKGGKPGPISAFIVETSTPGVEVVQRLEFMGIRGIENALLR